MRKLFIPISEITEAVTDKSRLEGYAFAILIKIHFVSSILKGSVCSQKKALRIGQNTLIRARKNALKYGYLIDLGNGRYLAKPIRDNGFNVRYYFDGTEKRTTKRRINHRTEFVKAKGGQTSLADVVFFLRQQVIKAKIHAQNAYSDTINLLKYGTPCEKARAKRRVKKMRSRQRPMWESTPHNNLSYRRMTEIAASSRYMAKNAIRGMLDANQLKKRATNIPMEHLSPLTIRKRERACIFYLRMSGHYAETNTNLRLNGEHGYIHQLNGKVYMRIADSFKDISRTIVYKKHA